MKKNALSTLFVLFFGVSRLFAVAPAWISNLSAEGRQQLAQSYRAAGEVYIIKGQASLGEQFLSLAQAIEETLPSIVPEPTPLEESDTEASIDIMRTFYSGKENNAPATASPTLAVFTHRNPSSANVVSLVEEATTSIEPTEFTTTGPLDESYLPNLGRQLSFPDTSEHTSVEQLQLATFFTYLEGWLTEDIDKIMTSLTYTMNLPLYPKGLNSDEQRLFFTDFFASYQLKSLEISDLYDLSTLSIVQFGDDRALLTVRSAKEAPKELDDWAYWSNFWNSNHHLFFQRIGVDRWRLISFDMEAIR